MQTTKPNVLKSLASLATFRNLALMAVATALILIGTATQAQASNGAVPNLQLSSTAPGVLTISWDAPDPTPSDYRVVWAKQDLDFLSYRLPNEANRGNEYPSGSERSITLPGLAKGQTFKVRARTRYTSGGQNDGPWSGPWTDTVTTRVKDDLPAAPTGVTADASHNSVTLSWTAPSQGTVTGYKVFRGSETDSLSAITQDTGNTSTEYTDSTVDAETTYFYAVLVLSQDGDGQQSATVSATTTADPKKSNQNSDNRRQNTNTIPTSSTSRVTATEDTAFTFSGSNFAFFDNDAGATLVSVKITALLEEGRGTLALDGTTITSTVLPRTVTKAELDAGKLIYTPPNNWNGHATFRFKVNDGSVDSASAYTMLVSVTSVNDLPTSSDKTVAIIKGDTHTFEADDFAFTDVDDRDTLASVKITTLPQAGTLTLREVAIAAAGLPKTVTKNDLDRDRLRFVPADNASGANFANSSSK